MPRARTTKTTTKKTAKKTTKKTNGARRAKATRSTKSKTAAVPADLRHQMIQESAYLKAEAHGFHSDPAADWLAAEAEVDARLRSRA